MDIELDLRTNQESNNKTKFYKIKENMQQKQKGHNGDHCEARIFFGDPTKIENRSLHCTRTLVLRYYCTRA